MKKNIFSFIFSFVLAISTFSQQEEKKVLTTADYEEAVKFLSFNTYGMVDRAGCAPPDQAIEDSLDNDV